MTAIFLAPLAFNVVTATQQAIAPASSLRLDEPGMVWRSPAATGAYVVAHLDGSTWDSIALVGSNLPAGSQWRLRAGDSESEVAGDSAAIDVTFDAWTGVAPTNGALSGHFLDQPSQHSFVRVDALGDAPQGYVELSRLVIGKRIEVDGVDIGAEQGFEDGSNVEEGLGYTTIDPYGVRITWKATVSNIKAPSYTGEWFPFLRSVGTKNAFVFIPDDNPEYLQANAIFGRIASSAKAGTPTSSTYTVDLQMKSVS